METISCESEASLFTDSCCEKHLASISVPSETRNRCDQYHTQVLENEEKKTCHQRRKVIVHQPRLPLSTLSPYIVHVKCPAYPDDTEVLAHQVSLLQHLFQSKNVGGR